jgi:hypothetical protein
MYNHPHQAKRAIKPLRAPLNLALLQNKMEKSQHALAQKRSFLSTFFSIGRPEREGTSSPRASPSPTWEGGRSRMRCGSGAGRVVSGL